MAPGSLATADISAMHQSHINTAAGWRRRVRDESPRIRSDPVPGHHTRPHCAGDAFLLLQGAPIQRPLHPHLEPPHQVPPPPDRITERGPAGPLDKA